MDHSLCDTLEPHASAHFLRTSNEHIICTYIPRHNTYIHTYTHTHTCIYIYIRTYIHTYIHTHTHTPIHTYRTYIHTYIHTHTHTHTHAHTVYDYPINYITLTTVSNVRAHRMEATSNLLKYVCLTETVFCQVLALFLLSPFLA